jgi:RNA polymerase sigma-70 factor (ECF subfamily)
MNLSLSPTCANGILMSMDTGSAIAEAEQGDVLSPLIQRMALGDEAALGCFYEYTLSRVYALALRITSRPDLAEDVCVEAYWQAWREAFRYDERRGQPLVWLMVITRTRALDALRRLDQVTYCEQPEVFLEHEIGPEDEPLDRLLKDEVADALRDALTVLSPIQRQMVALAFYRDLSHQEIADQTGLPLGTVKSHLKRAQDHLRKALAQA